MPIFSVVIPTYNRGHIVRQAIESVLHQSFRDFELIVVDDGSTDKTEELCSSIHDSRLRYIRQNNQGVSAARNRGVMDATGIYVTFLDSDDIALPEWLANFERLLHRPQVGVACCGYLLRTDEETQEESTVRPRHLGKLFCNYTGLFEARSFALRREIFDAIGGYVEGLTYSENTELALRLTAYCAENSWQVESISQPLAIYNRQSAGGARSRHNFIKQLESSEYILRHHAYRLRESPKVYSYFLGTAGVRAAKIGENAKAHTFFRSAIAAYPWNWRHYIRFLVAIFPQLSKQLWLRHQFH